MANYNSDLKTWGSTGTIYPDGYAYLEDEQPIDAWDNFFNSNVVDDLDHLVSLTNKRLETDTGTSHPVAPEIGHLSHRQDSETLHYWNDTNSRWHRLLNADGDQMSGVLDMGGNQIEDTTGPLTLAGDVSLSSGDLTDGTNTIFDSTNAHVPADIVEQGVDSGLDADLLDGKQATDFASLKDGVQVPVFASKNDVPNTITKGELVYIDGDALYVEDGS